MRDMLRKYIDLRLAFNKPGNAQRADEIGQQTAEIQEEIWALGALASQPTPMTALAISGMNGVLNSQGYAQAAWWNWIPIEAWAMMALTC